MSIYLLMYIDRLLGPNVDRVVFTAAGNEGFAFPAQHQAFTRREDAVARPVLAGHPGSPIPAGDLQYCECSTT
jgi:hypothetical protein